MEFFPIYMEQVENEEFTKLSPTKKCYYFLLQSMFNKFGEFYYKDANFAAALNCEEDTIRKARREFVKKGWIHIVPGRRDKYGRGLATQYKGVKWAKTPKENEGLRYAQFQRYSLEMLLNNQFSLDSIVVYTALAYWKHFHSLGDDEAFFITKTQLKELTGIKSMNKIENSITLLYTNFSYSGGTHLFEFEDQYHKYKFYDWSTPSEPSEDETNRQNQKKFWDRVVQKGNDIQQKKQTKEQERQLEGTEDIIDYFKGKYIERYHNEPNPFKEQILELMTVTKENGTSNMQHAINHFFTAEEIKGIPRSQRRTLKRFLDTKTWIVK